MQYKKIFLAGDIKYAEMISTTIKSICYHNKHLIFYILNKDFSDEWFDYLRSKLSQMGSRIIDVKVNYEKLRDLGTLQHISEASYYRFFIPEVLPEGKSLYLDCDTIITGDLSPLYSLDLNDHFLAAAPDIFLNTIINNGLTMKHLPDDLTHYFNSGVLLINNTKWKETNLQDTLIHYMNENNQNLAFGDQDALNFVIKDNWLSLPFEYNYQTKGKSDLKQYQLDHLIDEVENPLIIHYISAHKPWLNGYDIPFREVYWKYYQLEWQEIIEKQGK